MTQTLQGWSPLVRVVALEEVPVPSTHDGSGWVECDIIWEEYLKGYKF